MDPATALVSWQLAGFLVLLLPVIALIDLTRSQFRDSTHQLIWILIILFAPLIGPIVYFVLGRKYKLPKV